MKRVVFSILNLINKITVRFIFFFILCLALFQSNYGNAQETILLSFNSNEVIDSLKVENLSKGSSIVLEENYSLLLNIEWPTSVDIESNYKLPLYYPNPFIGHVNFEFNSLFNSDIELAIYNLSGRMIAEINSSLVPGYNRFIFSPDVQGTYFLRAIHNSQVYTTKLVCLGSNSGQPKIKYVGSVGVHSTLKNKLKVATLKSNEGLNVSIGDFFRFTAYSGKQTKTIFDILQTDKDYEFTFDDGPLILKKHLLQESNPCFIDIILSVSDTSGKGVEYLDVNDFIITEDGVEIRQRQSFPYLLKNEQVSTSLKTILLIDKSVESSSSLEAIKTAAIKFVEAMDNIHEVAIYTFSDTTQIRLDYTSNKTLLKVMINTIRADAGDRKLSDALIKGFIGTKNAFSLSQVSLGSLVLFTTDVDTKNSENWDNVIDQRGNKRVYSLVFGETSDRVLPQRIVHPKDYFTVQNLENIDAVIATIYSDILISSESFYRFNYMSEQREGQHFLQVSVRDNMNMDTTSFVSGWIDAKSFSSVSKGVYLNVNDSLKYGLDTIYCFQSRTSGIKFTNDVNGENILGIKELDLKPVTYGAISTPKYSWEFNKDEVCNIVELSLVEAVLSPVKESRDTVIITLRDDSNNFTKEIVFINNPPDFPKGEETILAQIKDFRLDEISGMAASVKNPGHYWVHNDSSDDANIYLINTQGYTVAMFTIASITSRDWEDIAIGPGPVEGETYIYIADIGDQNRKYPLKYIYRLTEPVVDTTVLKQSIRLQKNVVSTFIYQYADGTRDAEILMVDPLTKDLFVVTKRETNVQIYTLPYPQIDGDTLLLRKSSVTLPFRMTNGGDISVDGSEILIKNLTTVYYWKRKENESITETLARSAIQLPYIKEPQGEAIAWRRDGKGYLTVSEGEKALLYYYKR